MRYIHLTFGAVVEVDAFRTTRQLGRNPAGQLPNVSPLHADIELSSWGFLCFQTESRTMPAINQNQTATAPSEIVWGARAIALAIGRTEKSVFAMLEAGKLAGAKKVAGRWAFNPKVFLKSFDEAAA
jgi:hypothetical protein